MNPSVRSESPSRPAPRRPGSGELKPSGPSATISGMPVASCSGPSASGSRSSSGPAALARRPLASVRPSSERRPLGGPLPATVPPAGPTAGAPLSVGGVAPVPTRHDLSTALSLRPPAPAASSTGLAELRIGITEGSIFLACKGDRAARGAALARGSEFSLIPAPEGARTQVPSLSSSGAVYEVRLFNGRALQASCSCKDYIDTGRCASTAPPFSSASPRSEVRGSPRLGVEQAPSFPLPAGSSSLRAPG